MYKIKKSFFLSSINIMQKIEEKIKTRYLNKKDYKYQSVEKYNLNLEDNIILYNTGDKWKIIPLFISLSYPIIYDTYAYEDDKYDVTIIVCPITLRCVMFRGKFTFSNYDKYRMILKEDDDIMPIDLNHKINEKYVIQENKRIEVKIMTLKNSLMYAPDALFIKLHKNKTIDNIIDDKYYSDYKDIFGNDIKVDFIHPKTLVYVVNYQSKTSKEDKYSLLVGNDSNKENVSGYDVEKSKLNKHLMKYRTKIIEKNGYIIPMLWYLAKEIYDDYKAIFIH